MTDYKEKIQRLQQLVNEQEDRIIALEDKLKSFKEGTKALGIHPGLIEKGNSTITPIPQFTGISIRYHNILDDREKAIIKMNNRNKE